MEEMEEVGGGDIFEGFITRDFIFITFIFATDECKVSMLILNHQIIFLFFFLLSTGNEG